VSQKIGKQKMFKRIKVSYLLIMVLLLCSGALSAQRVQFNASVSGNDVATGEPFRVTFAINGNGSRFTPPDFTGFQILSGPNVSSSITSINGNTTVSNSYSYDLVAVKEGILTIGSAFIMVDERRLNTNPIRIRVSKGQPMQQNSQQQQQRQEEMIQDNAEDLSKALLLRAEVNKTNVYQGEQILLSYKLYTRAGIVDSRVDKLPDLNGFWTEDVKNQPQQVQWRTETYKGLKYNVADVKQMILFAEHSGDIKINPFEMTFIVRVAAPARDIMEQFFGSYKDVKYAVKSIPVVVHVKPLPEAGKPAGFSGAVGKFSIQARLDKKELKANETLNYSVKLTGSGNIKLINALNVNLPADFEKYDPKVTDTIKEEANGVRGNRTYSYLLIPRRQGNYTIEPLEFSYFDTSTKKYVTIATKAFAVKVNKGLVENNVTAFSDADQKDIKKLDKDIRSIKTGNAGLNKIGERFYGSQGYWLLLLSGPVLCALAFGFRNRNRKINSDVVRVKNRRAGKVAARHLANAQKQLAAKNTAAFYEAIFKGLYGYLSDKLNLAVADLNKESIVDGLKDREIGDQLITKLLETLDLCEMARYAPVTQLSELEVLEKAKGIINEIEDEIK